MTIRSLSKHFIRRWKQRVGAAPTVEGVNRILAGARKITAQRKLFEGHPRQGLKPWKLLAEYWHPRAGGIIRVDEDNRCAITVFADRDRIAALGFSA